MFHLFCLECAGGVDTNYILSKWVWDTGAEPTGLPNGFFNRKHAKCEFNMHKALPHNRSVRKARLARLGSSLGFQCTAWQITCTQMIGGTKKNREIRRMVSSKHIRSHFHSTPFNRIFLIYFHYASKRSSMMPLPWLEQSCAAHLAIDSVEWSCYLYTEHILLSICGTIQSAHTVVSMERTSSCRQHSHFAFTLHRIVHFIETFPCSF